MKYLSLFTGIGGFELGIEQAYEILNNRSDLRNRPKNLSKKLSNTKKPPNRFTCIGYSEIDKYAVEIYQKHFPTHKNYGDIKTIKEKELPDFDLIVGGFPCQSFSIAGKRKGFEDTRGTLFFDIARILKAKQPRLLLLENVKGLLSHDNGNTFRTIISALDELGYDLQWQVLNSKNHGVPQNRERILIIGHLRGTARPEVFPFSTNDKKINDLQGPVTNTLTARYEGAQATGSYIVENKLNAQKKIKIEGYLNDETWSKRHESIRRVYSTDGLSPTIPTGTGGGVMPKIMQRGRGKNRGGGARHISLAHLQLISG